MSKKKEWLHVISLPRVPDKNSHSVRWNLYLSHALTPCSEVPRHVMLRMKKLSFIKSSITLFLREVEWTKDKNWHHHVEVFYGCRGEDKAPTSSSFTLLAVLLLVTSYHTLVYDDNIKLFMKIKVKYYNQIVLPQLTKYHLPLKNVNVLIFNNMSWIIHDTFLLL